MRRTFAAAIPAACLLAASILLFGAIPAEAATRTVDCRHGDDLQAAIDAADPGDTLRIRGACAGGFTVMKDLRFVGVGKRPAIDATGAPYGLRVGFDGSTVLHTDVVVRGLTIRDSDGTGIDSAAGTVTVRASRILANRDGGIAGGDGVHVLVRDAIVRDNGGHGIVGASVRVRDSLVQRNGHHGIAAQPQGTAIVRDSRILGNGGAGVDSRDIDVRGTLIKGNQGGGITTGFQEHGGPVVGSVIKRNSTDGDGGGLRCAGDCTLVDTVVARNRATGNGGGIFSGRTDVGAPPPNLILERSRVVRNHAGGTGGGVFSEGSVQLTGVTLEDNTPNDCTGC